MNLDLNYLIESNEMFKIETPLEKYFGTYLSSCCRSTPIDFGNDPTKVTKLILADCKAGRIIDKIGNKKVDSKIPSQKLNRS